MKTSAMTQSISADYAQHEAVYRSLRAKGAEGWSSASEYSLMLKLVAPLLPAPKAQARTQVLELGSGAGNFSTALQQLGYAVTGVDISATAVEWATVRAKSLGSSAKFRLDNVVDLSTCED